MSARARHRPWYRDARTWADVDREYWEGKPAPWREGDWRFVPYHDGDEWRLMVINLSVKF